MFKIAAVLFLMVGTALAGVAMAVIVSVPSLLDQGATMIPLLCGAGFLVAIPVAYVVARMIAGSSAVGAQT